MLSDKIRATRREIETEWTLAEMAEAHLALDLQEDLAVLVDRRLTPPDPKR